MMQVWVVLDLEAGKAWVYFDENSAWKKKKARIKKYKNEEDLPHVYLRKLVVGTH